VVLLICIAVEASSSMDIDSANIATFALSSERHQRYPQGSTIFVMILAAA
jgi:hypothetical protein